MLRVKDSLATGTGGKVLLSVVGTGFVVAVGSALSAIAGWSSWIGIVLAVAVVGLVGGVLGGLVGYKTRPEGSSRLRRPRHTRS
jgi:membrane associated rhomboid family serine protease